MVSVPCTGFSKRSGVTNRDSIGPKTKFGGLSNNGGKNHTVMDM
jgi:hypothetical protein